MIRVERGPEVDGPQPNAGRRHGVFEYRVPIIDFVGYSRQPLLDACRQIKRILGPTEAVGQHVGVYRPGKDQPDISCSVLDGAELTVSEPSNGKIRFAKFHEFDSSVFRNDGGAGMSAAFIDAVLIATHWRLDIHR